MILKTHILPAFGNHQVGAIQHEKIQIFINRLFDEGYARNTLVNVLGVLSCSLRYAKRQRWIQFNPAEDIDLPTNRVCANQRQKVRVPVPRDIIKQIFERFPEESSAYLPLMLAYHCGLRRGEAFGVTWQDIDLEHGILFVNHQMQWSKLHVNYQYLPPKYGSVRRVVLDQVMLDVLRRTREQQLQRRTHYADKYVHNYIDNDGFLNHSGEGKEMDFLLCREDGAFMHHNVIDHASKVIRKELGYENFDFHSLRHTHASELNENGVNLKEIQRRLGHKTMEVTISTYLHATDMMEAESMRIINHRFTLSVLTDDFKSHDLSLTARNLLRDRNNPSTILQQIDKDEVTQQLRRLLEVLNKGEQTVKINDEHRAQIKEYLDLLDLTVDIDTVYLPDLNRNEKHTVITQPGLRYAQAEALIRTLMQDDVFRTFSLAERNAVTARILSDIQGRMMEDIVLLETKMTHPKCDVFKLMFDRGEFDMVVFDPEAASCAVYEVKYSTEAVDEQCRHLVDDAKCEATEFRYGPITGKYVIYRGETHDRNGIHYVNVEEYLNGLG